MTPDRPANSDACRSPYIFSFEEQEGSVVFLKWGSEPWLLKTHQKTACFTRCLLHRLQIMSKMIGADSLAGLGTGSGSLVCRAGHSSHSLLSQASAQGSPNPAAQPPVKHHGQKSLWCCWGRGLLVHSGSHNQSVLALKHRFSNPSCLFSFLPSSVRCWPALESARTQRSPAQHSSWALPWGCCRKRQGWKAAPACCGE